MTDPADTPPLRIREIRVTKLFGVYDHVIPLNLDTRVTILHGPNGVGKTVLLRLLKALFGGDLLNLSRIPYASFIVAFTDGTQIEVSWPQEKYQELQLVYAQNLLTLSDALMDHGSDTWLGRVRRQISVHMIEEQRLLIAPADNDSEFNARTFRRTVNVNAKELKDHLDQTLAHYAKQAGLLDQSFPTRLLRRASTAKISPEQLKTRMAALEQRRAKLREIGLLGEQDAVPFDLKALDQLDDSEHKVMALYIDDSEQKLAALDDLARRLDLLLRVINAKFRGKTLRVDLEQGFSLINHKGRKLSLSVLSSGEQHELVLVYNLLFRVKPGTLVLLDEPELSLHITWQKRFLADLLEIVQVAGLDVLMATHSPFIIGDRSDLMVALQAEEG